MEQTSAMTAIAISMIVMTSITVVWFATIITVLIVAYKKAKPFINTLNQTSSKITTCADNIKHTVDNFTAKVETITNKAEYTAGKIEDSMAGIACAALGTAEKVASKVEHYLNPKLLTTAAVVSTAYKVFSMYKTTFGKKDKEQKNKKYSNKEIEAHI